MTEAKRTFDWRAIVAATRPGAETAEQQSRAAVLPGIIQETTAWAAQHQLPLDRVEPCAYAGVVMTPAGVAYQHDLAVVLARYSVWLFAMDQYIDDLAYAGLEPEHLVEKQTYLDRRLQRFLQPLYDAGLSEAHARSCGLGPRLAEAELVQAHEDEAAQSFLFEIALRALYHDFQTLFGAQPHHDAAYCLQMLVQEAGRLLGAMRTEILLSQAYQATGTQPGFEDYLAFAQYSIGMMAAATVPLGFEANPHATWAAWAPRIVPAGRALRLANDLANVMRELAEAKINAVTITLATLGSSPQTPTQAVLEQAQRCIQQRLALELATFAQALPDPDGPLSTYVHNSTAVTIAMYSRGDFII